MFVGLLVLALGAMVVAGRLMWPATRAATWVAPQQVADVPSAPSPRPTKLVVHPAPGNLPVIDYLHVPGGFPADTQSSSTEALTEGLHPTGNLAVYDAPGGKPRAFLPSRISGVEVTVPIVARQSGWVAVLLPSVDRRLGWLPGQAGWAARPLHDQLVLRRGAHELTWLRDGVLQKTWTVATGAAQTPTPLGRTFVLGRTTTDGAVYAGLDALVLGSVPEEREALAPGLRNGHTAIHSWYRTSAFGHSVSNGCIRVPQAGQRTLLHEIAAGTLVTVLD